MSMEHSRSCVLMQSAAAHFFAKIPEECALVLHVLPVSRISFRLIFYVYQVVASSALSAVGRLINTKPSS